MKTKLIFLLLCASSFLGFSQRGELKVYDNGLIYSDATISKLRYIVDSLNLKFKTCDLNKKYYAIKIAKANHLSVSKKKIKEAQLDIQNNISFNDFIAKYPNAKASKDLPITFFKYKNYEDVDVIEISSIELNRNDNFSLSFENEADINTVIKGNWIVQYHPKTKYSDEALSAFYLTEEFKSNELNPKYAKLIQYSDCLIDTTATIFSKKAKEVGIRYFDSLPDKPTQFIDYYEKLLNKPNFDNDDFEMIYGFDTLSYAAEGKKVKISKKELAEREIRLKEAEKRYAVFSEALQKWENERSHKLDSLKINRPDFMKLLNEAYEEAKIKSNSNDEFDELVSLYISKEAALELKRNRIVIGGCSMDVSPRIHAQNIAVLSAETTKWEIFLQSHLNIMNDRFQRVSDGSWAQAERKTYIRELEELNINVIDLLIGISLRVENPSNNHYFGNIQRLGRALAESKNRIEFETKVLLMITDDELDIYNRIMLFYLFDNYNYYITDADLKKSNKEKLRQVASLFPDYIASKIEVD